MSDIKRPSPPPNPPKPQASRVFVDCLFKFDGELSALSEFNSASRLPPVGCKLVILVGGHEMIATRTGYIGKRDDELEYELEATGELISGKFEWSYP